jgi:transposase
VAGLRPDRYAQGHRWSGNAGAAGADGGSIRWRIVCVPWQTWRVKLLWYDGQGMCLFSKRLETGHFVWPVTETGRVSLTPAQLSMLLEGIDWRMPLRVRRPELAG